MTTIKIHDANESSMEFMNNGYQEQDEITIQIDHCDDLKNTRLFFLTKEDAKSLIAYLRSEFRLK